MWEHKACAFFYRKRKESLCQGRDENFEEFFFVVEKTEFNVVEELSFAKMLKY